MDFLFLNINYALYSLFAWKTKKRVLVWKSNRQGRIQKKFKHLFTKLDFRSIFHIFLRVLVEIKYYSSRTFSRQIYIFSYDPTVFRTQKEFIFSYRFFLDAKSGYLSRFVIRIKVFTLVNPLYELIFLYYDCSCRNRWKSIHC